MKSLSTDHPIDNDLKVVKDSDGTNSALEISKDKVRIKDLEVTGTSIGVDTNVTVDSVLHDTSANPVENNAVFDGLALKLNLAGGTMSGNLDMGDNRLSNAQRVQFNDGSGYITEIIDNDDMSLTSSTKISSSESIKAYVDAEILSVSPKGGSYTETIIKVMPTEFMVDDGYNGRSANMIDDDTTDTLGFRMGSALTTAHAFVKIPQFYKATHVLVNASDSTSNAVVCKTFNYTSGATTDLETFDFNVNRDITDVNHGLASDLVIKILPASTSTLIYGARVTIASV